VKLITYLHLEPKLIMTTAINYPHVWLLGEHRENFNLYVNIGLSTVLDIGLSTVVDIGLSTVVDPGSRRNDFS
jgi:hypothetical protein